MTLQRNGDGDPAEPAAPIGRSLVVAAARAAIVEGRSTHLLVRSGPAQGRTSLLAHIGSMFAVAADARLITIHADDADPSQPLGAITAALVDRTITELPTTPPIADRDDPAERIDTIAGATRTLLGDGRPPVVVVDEVHGLDPDSGAVLAAVARSGATLVLGTGRTDAVPTALRSLLRSGSVHEVTIDGLDDADVARLASSILIGPIEPVVIRALTRLVGGASAAIVDVIRAAHTDGRLRRLGHVWRLDGPLTLPPITIDRVGGVIRRLSDDDLETLDLVALAEPAPLDMLERMVRPGGLDSLESRGMIEFVPAPGDSSRQEPTSTGGHDPVPPLHVRLLDQAVRSARLSTMPTSRRRRLVGQLLEALAATANGDAKQDDPLLPTRLALQLGAPIDLQMARSGAAAARRRHDIELAEPLARQAFARSGEIADALVLAEIMMSLGRTREVEELLRTLSDSAPSRQPPDQASVALLAMLRAVNLGQHLELIPEARQLLDEVLDELDPGDWTAEVMGLSAVTELLVGDTTEALRRVEPWLEPGSGRSFVEAATAAGPALVVGGRHLDAAELAGRALDERLRLGDQPFLSSPGLHALVRSMALAEAGELTEADALSHTVMDLAAAAGDRDAQAWAGIIGGRSMLDQGRLDDARAWFEIATSAAIDANRLQHLRWARAGIVLASAQTSDTDDTDRALDALDSCPATQLLLMEPEVDRARAWACVARHDLAGARTLLLGAADRARDAQQPGLEIRALHDLVRLNDVARVDRLIALHSEVQGPLPACRIEHGRALSSGDADALLEVGAGFATIGAILFAAEAANQACQLHRRAGRPAAAEAARQRVLQLRASVPAAATPALDPLAGAAWLTAREREVVVAAAGGASSKAIAARLGVSVRTVDNLLQRSYRKLGLHGRTELRELRIGRRD